MLSRATPVAELSSPHLKCLFYGVNRVGKTTLACQFPKPLLLISAEPVVGGGALSVRKIAGVELIHVTNMHDYWALLGELAEDGHYKTHVLDGATSLQELVLIDILAQRGERVPEQLDFGVISQDDYRDRASKTKEALKPLLALKANTVVLAKEKDHQPPQERNKLLRGLQVESFFASDVGGSTAGWLHDSCDYLGRLYIARETKTVETQIEVSGAKETHSEEVETGRQVRRMLTMLQTNFAAGFRSDTPGLVPEYVEAGTPEEMFKKIMMVINGQRIAGAKYV
jgi:hypothetical protein